METKTIKNAFILLVFLIAACVDAQAGVAQKFPLGKAGEVQNWLTCGYIPLAIEQDDFKTDLVQPTKVLEADFLTDQGGEAKVQPVGGQKFTLADNPALGKGAQRELVWQMARGNPLGDANIFTRSTAIWMFSGPDGKQFEKHAVYLYCRLVADEELKCTMNLGSDDACKIFLNGTQMYKFVGQRSAGSDSEELPITLRKGSNDLLVRIDNYIGTGGLHFRLVKLDASPVTNVHVELPGDAKMPEFEIHRGKIPTWEELVATIPPVAPARHEEFFGARLSRTMSLLETSHITGRPVKLLFYGQSIETEWTHMVVRRLRERYPDANIVMENNAIGGWFVHRLLRCMGQNIIRNKPDLVLFHAYQGSPQHWEYLFQLIRRETTAEIMIRTAHIAGPADRDQGPYIDDETLMLRGLAQKYNVEMVDLRQEWIDYLTTNKLPHRDFLLDGIHLNAKGSILMAQLYERHFRPNTLAQSQWMNSVRWYGMLRPDGDRKNDEIRLEGKGWKINDFKAVSSTAGDAIKLKFTGNRVDVVMNSGSGSALILIDGKKPSEWNLYRGNLPIIRNRKMNIPASVARYHCGPNMQEEIWELTFDDITPDMKKISFSLHGSKTGPDGSGNTEELFVSRSGRIIIAPQDWVRALKPSPILTKPASIVWQIMPNHADIIRCTQHESRPEKGSYITVADGLPHGEHELTILPQGDGDVSVQGIEVHNPPMAGK